MNYERKELSIWVDEMLESVEDGVWDVAEDDGFILASEEFTLEEDPGYIYNAIFQVPYQRGVQQWSKRSLLSVTREYEHRDDMWQVLNVAEA